MKLAAVVDLAAMPSGGPGAVETSGLASDYTYIFIFICRLTGGQDHKTRLHQGCPGYALPSALHQRLVGAGGIFPLN